MFGRIDDIMEELIESDTNLNAGNLDIGGISIDNDFLKLLEEVQKELYHVCTLFSSLDFIAKLMHIKENNK